MDELKLIRQPSLADQVLRILIADQWGRLPARHPDAPKTS